MSFWKRLKITENSQVFLFEYKSYGDVGKYFGSTHFPSEILATETQRYKRYFRQAKKNFQFEIRRLCLNNYKQTNKNEPLFCYINCKCFNIFDAWFTKIDKKDPVSFIQIKDESWMWRLKSFNGTEKI